jgi:hypothetical protein
MTTVTSTDSPFALLDVADWDAPADTPDVDVEAGLAAWRTAVDPGAARAAAAQRLAAAAAVVARRRRRFVRRATWVPVIPQEG